MTMQKLNDALDLLKMLELVYDQRNGDAQRGDQPNNTVRRELFPWGGSRITLRQARELLEESLLELTHLTESEREDFPEPAGSKVRDKRHSAEQLKTGASPVQSGGFRMKVTDGATAGFRGTFNRIQLTADTSEGPKDTSDSQSEKGTASSPN